MKIFRNIKILNLKIVEIKLIENIIGLPPFKKQSGNINIYK